MNVSYSLGLSRHFEISLRSLPDAITITATRPDCVRIALFLSVIVHDRTIRQGLLSSALLVAFLPLMLFEASRSVASVNCFSFIPPKGHLPFVSTFTVLIMDDVTTTPVYFPPQGETLPRQKGFILFSLFEFSLQSREISSLLSN